MVQKDMADIIVAGKNLQLTPMERTELRGLSVDTILGYTLKRTHFQGNEFILMCPKKDRKLAPLQYKSLAEQTSAKLGAPCVFLFGNLPTYERNRLIERGVYFIVSGKYAFLPYLLINSKETTEVKKDELQACAQYLLLYHLQQGSLNGLCLSELEQLVPYKYVTLSRAIRQLEALQLLSTTLDEDGTKRLTFNKEARDLWEASHGLATSPVKDAFFVDEKPTPYYIGGISALSHYSHLNPESVPTCVLSKDEFKRLKEDNALVGLNKLDGEYRIEVWKYPPIVSADGIVDRLSIFLTLRDDKDPRVEKELDRMIAELW